jgi:hypothetical protein
MMQCVYSIPCECGRSYTGETSRPLAVWLREHRHNLEEGLLEKSKLAQHVYEENHRVFWDEARILEIESNSRHRIYKESAHMVWLKNAVSQPSLDLSHSCPLIIDEVTKSKGSQTSRTTVIVTVTLCSEVSQMSTGLSVPSDA